MGFFRKKLSASNLQNNLLKMSHIYLESVIGNGTISNYMHMSREHVFRGSIKVYVWQVIDRYCSYFTWDN